MNRVHWNTLVEVLSRVERLSSNDSGLLSFGPTPLGGIFVERGRVCWVAARGLQQRLRDLLEDYTKDVDVLARVAERCRAEGLLLGQTLVAEGLLEPSELEVALRRHSAECLIELCRTARDQSWASHAGRGYAPRFTFCAKDLLFDSVALLYPRFQLEARGQLAELEEAGRCCVAFLLDTSLGALLPIAETGGNGVEGMLALGAALAGVPRAGRELATTPTFALSVTGTGHMALTWWRDNLLFVVSCRDRASIARVVAQRLEHP